MYGADAVIVNVHAVDAAALTTAVPKGDVCAPGQVVPPTLLIKGVAKHVVHVGHVGHVVHVVVAGHVGHCLDAPAPASKLARPKSLPWDVDNSGTKGIVLSSGITVFT